MEETTEDDLYLRDTKDVVTFSYARWRRANLEYSNLITPSWKKLTVKQRKVWRDVIWSALDYDDRQRRSCGRIGI